MTALTFAKSADYALDARAANHHRKRLGAQKPK